MTPISIPTSALPLTAADHRGSAGVSGEHAKAITPASPDAAPDSPPAPLPDPVAAASRPSEQQRLGSLIERQVAEGKMSDDQADALQRSLSQVGTARQAPSPAAIDEEPDGDRTATVARTTNASLHDQLDHLTRMLDKLRASLGAGTAYGPGATGATGGSATGLIVDDLA